MSELRTKLVNRNDTTANWELHADKVLLKGEVGVEFLTSGKAKVKIGDGVTEWGKLPYFGGDAERYYEVIPTEGQSHEDAIAAAVNGAELNAGDVAIVKELISGTTYQYTAYVYNGTAWAATDGNYSAANVYLKEDVTVTTKTGELAVNAKIAAGTSLQDMLVQMLSQSKDPTKSNPSVSAFSVTNNGSGDTFEAGTSITPKWESTFSAGSYTYKSTAAKDPITPVSGTGVAVTGWSITQDGTEIGTTEDGTGAAFVLGDSDVVFKAKATYGAGNYALTNLNKLPKTDVQIAAGTTPEKSDTIYTFRKMFAGGVTDAAAEITSDVIRGLSTGVQATTAATEFAAKVGDTKLIFAYPSTLSTKEPTFEYFTMSWESFAGFTKQTTTVNVADARGGENGLKAYTVYTYTPTGAFEAGTKFRVTF